MTEWAVRTQSEAWVMMVHRLMAAPVVQPRGMPVREWPSRATIIVSRPTEGFVQAEGRKFNHAVTAIEGTSLVGQISAPELILDRVGAFAPYANDGVFWGAYGPRVAGDVGQLVGLLTRDSDSRQAVLSIFDSDRDLGRTDVKDVPCTVAIQFFLRDRWTGPEPEDLRKHLDMWVVMRSNDAWLGLPYDLGQFSILQMAIAQALHAEVGTYTHSVGSMHLYERNWEDAALVSNPTSESVGHTFGGPGDIESTARRARRVLLGQGLDVDGLSSLERWLVKVIDK